MTQWGLDSLFNPAKRHMDEEKRRLQSTREEVGDNSGGNRIDLESGKVLIRRRKDGEDGRPDAAAEDPTDAAGDDSDDSAAADSAAAADADAEDEKVAETAQAENAPTEPHAE